MARLMRTSRIYLERAGYRRPDIPGAPYGVQGTLPSDMPKSLSPPLPHPDITQAEQVALGTDQEHTADWPWDTADLG